MKINPNYTIRFKGTENKDKVQTENSGSNATVKELGPVTPDYGVSVPINYAKTEEIKLPNNLTAYCYKLANGQKVVIVPKEGTTVVKTYVNTGSLNEPDNVRGISHYIEHNLFNGSESLGDKVFFDEVHNIGAYTNASTSFSVTDYYISSNLLDDLKSLKVSPIPIFFRNSLVFSIVPTHLIFQQHTSWNILPKNQLL